MKRLDTYFEFIYSSWHSSTGALHSVTSYDVMILGLFPPRSQNLIRAYLVILHSILGHSKHLGYGSATSRHILILTSFIGRDILETL